MIQVTIHEAKTHLSRLLRIVVLGEEIIIARGGKPIARLVPIQDRPSRELGCDQGLFEVPHDFDGPLPEELLQAFEG